MFLVRICPTFSVDLFVHLLPPCSSGRSQIYTEVPVSHSRGADGTRDGGDMTPPDS